MGYWATATVKEGPKEFYEDNRVIDRCIFCGQEKEIKTKMTIFFSEHETNTGPICKTCYHANAKQVKAV